MPGGLGVSLLCRGPKRDTAVGALASRRGTRLRPHVLGSAADVTAASLTTGDVGCQARGIALSSPSGGPAVLRGEAGVCCQLKGSAPSGDRRVLAPGLSV